MAELRRRIEAMRPPKQQEQAVVPVPAQQEEPGAKLFKIIVRVADATDAPPEVSYEVTGYTVTNVTENSFVLRKIGEDVRGVTNVTKDKVSDMRPVIRRNIAVGDSGQIWASAETWVFGNVDMYVGMVKNDIAHALTYFRTRAQRIIDHIESEE